VKSFLHSGCFGDILYALPAIQALGGGILYLCDRPWTKPLLWRRSAIVPLLMQQPCIENVAVYDELCFPDYDFSTFRSGGLKYGEPIIDRQSRWVRAKIDLVEPWLSAPYITQSSPIVVHRGSRWHGFHFPWRELVEEFRTNMVFVGFPQEHVDFCKAFGSIPYHDTKDLLDLASVVAGAEMFIGSQSVGLSIAEGLHKRTITEVCCWAPDCFYVRPGNIHVTSGSLDFKWRNQEFHYEMPRHRPIQIEAELMSRAESTRLEIVDRD